MSSYARRAAHLIVVMLIAASIAPILQPVTAGTPGPGASGVIDAGGDSFVLSLEHAAFLGSDAATLVALDAATRSEAAAEAPAGSVPVYYPVGGPNDEANRRFGTLDVLVRADAAPSTGVHGVVSVSPVSPGVWRARVDDAWTAEDDAAALRASPGVQDAYVLLSRFAQPRLVPDDTLFPQQWHLQNTGQNNATPGVDINVTGIWDTASATGVVISVVDDGVQYAHPDLGPAYRPDLAGDQCGPDSDPAPEGGNDHGTAVAGVAAARGNNGQGVTGAARNANLTAQRLIACAASDTMEAAALAAANTTVAISTNSWGPPDTGNVSARPGAITDATLTALADSGRGGKGIIYTWAGGNGLLNGDHGAYDGYVNHPAVIAVGAIGADGRTASYSEDCSCLLVSAPSSTGAAGMPGITTTDRTGADGYNTASSPAGDYASSFGGTSAATPLVAGVVALMVGENPNLTARDVQAILALTANRSGLVGGGFAANGAGLMFSHEFGFGRVDAGRAVETARTWTPLSARQTVTVQNVGNDPIADNSSTNVTRVFGVASNVTVEKAILTFNATHPWHNDLRMVLRSPAGTEAVVLPGRLGGSSPANFVDWRVSANNFMGETSVGNWTVFVRDLVTNDTGSLGNVTLTLYGRAPSGGSPGGGGGAGPLVVSVTPQVVNAGSVALTIRVNDSNNTPVSGAQLSSTPTNLFPNGTMTDGAGAFAFVANVSAGNYTILATTSSPARNGTTILQVNPASSPGGGGGGGGGGPTPCAGALSITGEVRVQGAVNGTVRVRAFGPCSVSPVVVAGDFATGAPFTLGNLTSGGYNVEAWVDDDGDQQVNGVEPVASQFVNAPATNILLVVGGGGGGAPGGFGEFTGPPGGLNLNGTIYYNGSLANGSYQFEFQPTPGGNGTFGEHRSKTSGGAFSFTGFNPGNYSAFAWKETDNIGGPSVNEPIGFFAGAGGYDHDPEVALLDSLEGVIVEFRDPGPDGWDPGMIPSHGGPGGPGGGGGGGGCDQTGGGTIIGHVGDDEGNPLSTAFVSIQNQTSHSGEFPQMNASSLGTFTCRLPAGNYRVEANNPDHGFKYVEFNLAVDETQHVWLNLSFDFRPPYSRPTTFYGGTVWGNVTYENGTGIDGVRVNFFRAPETSGPGPSGPGGCQPADPGLQTLSTCGGEGETNSSGTFVATYLGNGTYDMFIDGAAAGLPSRFVSRAFTFNNASSGAETKIDLGRFNFSPPGGIRGYVTRASDSSAVVDADVSAYMPCFPGAECSGGGGFDRTNATGYYEIAASPGLYGMSAHASGPGLIDGRRDCGDFDPSGCVNVTAGNITWVNFTLGAGSTLSGRVTDGSSAPVRAFVNVENCGGFGPCDFYWGQTDFTGGGPGGGSTSGFYNITVTPGTFRVRVEPDRFERPDLASNTTEGIVITSGNTTYHNVSFSAGAALRGRVTTPTGAPAQFVNLNANVHCDPGPGGGCFGGFGGFGFTDQDGEYRISGLAPGFFDVFVEPGFGAAFMRTEVRNVQVVSGSDTWVNLTLSSGGTLAGYVTLASGTPVSGASVDAFYQPDFEPGAPGAGPGPASFPSSGGWGHDGTDGTGYYEVRGLANGTFGMFVNPPFGTSYTSAHLEPFRDELPTVTIGGTTWRNFTLGSGGQITGCVRSPDNATPIQFAWVSAFSLATGFGGGEPTRSDGCFTIRGVRAGTFEVEVNPPFNSDAGRTRVLNVVVTEGNTTDLGYLRLSAGVQVTGRVTSGGSPVVGAFVNVFEQHDPGDTGPGAFGFGVTDAAGDYVIRGLQAGRYGAHVQPPFGGSLSAKFVPEIIVNDSGSNVYNFTLGGGGWITGTVRDGSGTALANAWVGAWSFNGGSGGGTITNASGAFNISGLAAASDYNFDVFPPHNRQSLATYHDFPVTVSEGSGTWRNVSLATGGSLIGRVLDATGTGVAFAFVDVNGNNSFAWGMTDSDGNFSVSGLRIANATNVTVFVQPQFGSTATPARFTHTWAANATDVSNAGNLTLDAGRNITGRVTRDGTTGIGSADVFVMPALPYFGPPIGGSATTSSGGWYNITGLPAGQSWDVRIEPNDGTAGGFQASALSTNDTVNWFNFSFGSISSGNLSVRIVDGSGVIDGAHVDCFSEAARDGAGGNTNATGWANLTGLATGAYTCRAFAANHTGAEQNVTVTAGATATTTLTLGSVTTVRVSGVVSTTNASGASGYLVLLVPNGTVDATEYVGNNVTDSGGNYTFFGVPANTYDIKVLNSSGRVVATRLALVVSTTDATENIDAGAG